MKSTREGSGQFVLTLSRCSRKIPLCDDIPDSLRAASRASWRIKYYLRKGDKTKARKIADDAGEVYSFAGLEAKGEFHEAVGEYELAFQTYTNLQERYEDSGPLVAFCARYKAKTGSARFERVIQDRLSKLFPKGVEKASLKDFPARAPADGVFIGSENDLLQKAGLKYGDVIVAVQGIRVHNFEQYAYGRELKADPELDLIVWQGSSYVQVKASPPGHRFGADFTDYPKK